MNQMAWAQIFFVEVQDISGTILHPACCPNQCLFHLEIRGADTRAVGLTSTPLPITHGHLESTPIQLRGGKEA